MGWAGNRRVWKGKGRGREGREAEPEPRRSGLGFVKTWTRTQAAAWRICLKRRI